MNDATGDWGLRARTVLVTGAGRGIGRACALGLLGAGARVIAVARTRTDLEALAAASGDAAPLTCWVEDVCSDSLLARIEALPELDVLVNNAGTNRPGPMTECDDANLDVVLDLNVRAAFRVARSAVRVMQRAERGGSVVHMSSQMGHVGAANRTVYCMTKSAIEGLTRAMAVELGPANIRVNSVAPTFIETPMTRPMLEDAQFREWVMGMLPLGKLGAMSDVVNAVLYLASPLSGSTTGHSLRVDGGWTAA